MNTITFSDYEATTTGKSTLCSGIGYNVEIKKEETAWSIWAVATIIQDKDHETWKLTHIRIVGKENEYPGFFEISQFMIDLDAYLDFIMNKLIPSHKNANNEQF